LARIEINPKIMRGKPVIRGTRLTVQHILGLMASGATDEEILSEYNRLTPEDLQACLLFSVSARGDQPLELRAELRDSLHG